MKTPKIIIRHVIKELFLYSLFAVFLITFLLVMANLLRHEDSVFWILRKSKVQGRGAQEGGGGRFNVTPTLAEQFAF